LQELRTYDLRVAVVATLHSVRPDLAGRLMKGARVTNQTSSALYLVVMIAVIITVDVLFFKHRIWERLAVNVGIVLVFGAFYFRLLKHP